MGLARRVTVLPLVKAVVMLRMSPVRAPTGIIGNASQGYFLLLCAGFACSTKSRGRHLARRLTL